MCEDSPMVSEPLSRTKQPALLLKYLLRRIIGEASENAGVGGAALAVGGGETSSLLGNELADGLRSIGVDLDDVSRCSSTHLVPLRTKHVPRMYVPCRSPAGRSTGPDSRPRQPPGPGR